MARSELNNGCGGGSGDGGMEAMQRGTELFKEGRFKEAIAQYEIAIDAGITSKSKGDVQKKCLSNIAASYLKLGEDEVAEQWARKCIHVDSTWCKAHARLAACFSQRQGDKDAARALASYRTVV